MLKNVLFIDFKKIGIELIKEYDDKEIEEINESCRKQVLKKKYNQLSKPLFEKNKSIKWNKRPYQIKAMNEGLTLLKKDYKFYLELATGGGKTFIIYSILSVILPEILIIFSPRKKINFQNQKTEYLSILKHHYSVFNLSTDKSFENFISQSDKKIIVACIQSYEKVYHLIHQYNLSNVFI